MAYVDGFVIPVRLDNRDAYLKSAQLSSEVFRDCGATEIVECWADDLPDAKVTGFRLAVKAEADETVVFSWVVWPSKAARDEGNRKFMADPRMQTDDPMAFDGKRLIFGGFAPMLEKRFGGSND